MLKEMLPSRMHIIPYTLKNQERRLINNINLGDVERAKEIFEEMLSDIFKIGAIKSIKVKVIEVILTLSRTLVDLGANSSEILQLNTQFIFDVMGSNSTEQISSAAGEVVEAYSNHITINESKPVVTVKLVKEYILRNYHRSLTLEEIAKSVYLSSSHISHIFKEIEGISVMEYLTQTRIEKAKILLRNPNYPIAEISEKLGYKEPSYFTKVFRRKEGRTPKQYRKLGCY